MAAHIRRSSKPNKRQTKRTRITTKKVPKKKVKRN